ncbi:MAG: glutathione S-transferase family protein, partial [Rhodospirillales bacterium]|nr:glutathione S-transferase family protein [Rhodospirillales bacterium]
MLTVWGRRSSSNVQAVLWGLTELEVPFERIDAGFRYGVTDTPDYRAMNPNGLVPTVKDGDALPLWESGAILRYLANRYAPEAFWPADPAARAQVDMWAEWSKLNIASRFTGPIFWRVVRTPPSKHNPYAIAAGVKGFEAALTIAERRLAGQAYLASKDFTLADIQFGHCLYRYYDIAIERGRFSAVRRYYEALAERPAFRDCVMVSYD